MGITSAQQAYDLVHQGKIEEMKVRQVGEFFTWGEVFRNCSDGEIISAQLVIYNKAVMQAQLMDEVRLFIEHPVIVSSWYRSLSHNLCVGGKSHSYHLMGQATDFSVEGQNLKEIYNKLDKSSIMAKAGLEAPHDGVHLHIDSRGYYARF